ncbi:MAG: endonuclease/exonuclease/phosphatase family protein, partial [Ferruginibacter sp.]
RRLTKGFFITVNVIAAILFLLGCYGYLFNPKYFWPIGFLTLGAFYFLLLLMAFIIFWLFVKPRHVLISVVALLAAYKPISNIIPFGLSHSFVKERQDSSLRIMTWNVAQFNVLDNKKHPERQNQMLDLVNEYQPDIACFQEMVAEDSVVKDHGHIDGFLERLKFKDYFYSYNPKEDFWGYAHFGVIIFSKYPIINRQTVSFYPNNYNSIFQYIDIVKGPDTFRVFNIHLQTLRFSRENLNYIDKPSVEKETAIKESKNIIAKFKQGFLKRQIQADRIRAEMNLSPYPVIVTGDFNDVPNSYAYHTIGKGMKNAFVERNGAGLGRTFSGISPVLRIDNIFVDQKIEVKQFVRIKKKLSDHFPIVADLQLPAGK